MRLWPFYSVAIKTNSLLEECFHALSAEVEPINWFRLSFSKDHKIFQGSISREEFKICRIIHYRNSFLPTVFGQFKAVGQGTIISLKMKLNMFVAVFMCVWFSGVLVALVTTSDSLFSKNVEWWVPIIPLAMLIFGIALVCGGFWPEANRAKFELEKIFNAPRENLDATS